MSPRLINGEPWSTHRRLLIDTNVWIYDLNNDQEFGQSAADVLRAMHRGCFQGIASEISLLELLVLPFKLGQNILAKQYELLLLSSSNLTLAPIQRDVLRLAARLRAAYLLKAPDAIIVATGILHGATLAITNDSRWLRITELKVILLKSAFGP